MTTIAYRSCVLAADSRAFSGHSTPIGFKQKIYQRADGAMIGVSSATPGLPERVVAWFMKDCDHDMEPQLGPEDGIDAIMITSDEKVFIFHDSMSPAGPLQADYWAVGSGANYALGALAVGADAIEAVQAGIVNDPWSGGNITVLHAKNAKEK